MKRTELKRKTALKRGTPVRRRVKVRVNEPGRTEFKKWRYGVCDVCEKPGWTLRHHVVREQHVRREGGDPWDPRNSMWLGVSCRCHRRHTDAFERIPLRKVPADAIVFAFGLMDAWAADYLRREYAGDDERVARLEAHYADK